MTAHVAEDVLWLDITMANAFGMDVGNTPHELVGVELNNQVWHLLLHFVELLHHSVRRVRDVVHYHV